VAREIDSAAALEEVLRERPQCLKGWVFQGLDLKAHSSAMRTIDCTGSVFLGCLLDDALAGHLARQGCLCVPPLEGKEYHPFRTSLYSVEELFEGFDPAAADRLKSYQSTPDYRIYRSFRDPDHPQGALWPVLVDEQLSRRIHDSSISDALEEWLHDLGHRSLVAVMGGHAVPRSQPLYREIAELSRSLRRQGLLPASGGGPGLMEATNLGAFLAPHPDEALQQALQILSTCPTFRDGVGEWLATGMAVRQAFPPTAGGESLGIPTWFYGHEPPNVFASHIAKYFENSLREEGLLALATGGIVFAPGGAGTVQEIFQDACQNYYTTYEVRSPMIFYPRAYWTDDPQGIPCYPAVERLATRGAFQHLVHLVDDLRRAERILLEYPD